MTERIGTKMSEEKKDQTFLEVKNLKVEYFSDGHTVHAVNGVSLKIEQGKTLGLVGETGQEKRPLQKRFFLRILPDVGSKVSEGQVYLDGKELFSLPEQEMKKIRGNGISMIFQIQ